MKNVILMGRGIEGCGVTKCVIEFSRTQPCEVFATRDKVWGRRTAHGDFGAVEFTAADWSECESVLSRIGPEDRVIVYSLPSLDHPKECQDNFLEMIRRIPNRIAMIHLDHSVKSLHNNAHLLDVVREVDVVMTHSVNGSLGRLAAKSSVATPVVSVGLGFDFDSHRARWWRPVDETDDWGVRWVGRTTRWKGVQDVLDFHESHLRPAGYKTMLEGLEASINWVIACYYDEHGRSQPRDVILKFRAWPGQKIDKDIRHGSEERGDAAYLYPPYVNEECMARLSRTAFGSDLYHLPAAQYGSSIENCHAEVVASGCVPIFHKHFGDNVVHRVTGDPCSQSDRSGTIWLDDHNRDACLETMLRLSQDRVMRDEHREMAFEFWRSHADSRLVSADIVGVLDGVQTPSNIEEFFS